MNGKGDKRPEDLPEQPQEEPDSTQDSSEEETRQDPPLNPHQQMEAAAQALFNARSQPMSRAQFWIQLEQASSSSGTTHPQTSDRPPLPQNRRHASGSKRSSSPVPEGASGPSNLCNTPESPLKRRRPTSASACATSPTDRFCADPDENVVSSSDDAVTPSPRRPRSSPSQRSNPNSTIIRLLNSPSKYQTKPQSPSTPTKSPGSSDFAAESQRLRNLFLSPRSPQPSTSRDYNRASLSPLTVNVSPPRARRNLNSSISPRSGVKVLQLSPVQTLVLVNSPPVTPPLSPSSSQVSPHLQGCLGSPSAAGSRHQVQYHSGAGISPHRQMPSPKSPSTSGTASVSPAGQIQHHGVLGHSSPQGPGRPARTLSVRADTDSIGSGQNAPLPMLSPRLASASAGRAQLRLSLQDIAVPGDDHIELVQGDRPRGDDPGVAGPSGQQVQGFQEDVRVQQGSLSGTSSQRSSLSPRTSRSSPFKVPVGPASFPGAKPPKK